ncbi:unnamed protein product, partial [Rotaria socialis]
MVASCKGPEWGTERLQWGTILF